MNLFTLGRVNVLPPLPRLRTCLSNKKQSEVYLDQLNVIFCLHVLNTEYFGSFDLDIELQKCII